MLIVGQWLAPLLVFGLVVFIHELGHFLAAKRAGVYTPRFSIGFGPALWKRKIGETEYVLAAIPLGGYVRMASREEDSMAALEGGGEKGLDIPPDRFFESKSLPVRIGILVAGVSMNVLLGYVIFTTQILVSGRQWAATRVVKDVLPVVQAPDLASAIQPGDTILAIDGKPVAHWGDVYRGIMGDSGATLRITTQRGARDIALSGSPLVARQRIVQALNYQIPAVIGDVMPDGPADHAGIAVGDTILRVAGVPVSDWDAFVQRIKPSPEADLVVDVSRGGAHRTLTVKPRKSDIDPKIGQILVTPGGSFVREPVGFGEAVTLGARETWAASTLIATALKDLATRKTSLKSLQGPVGIVRQSAAAARQGWGWLFRLIALLSINVALLNMLPIPILDGGQILMNVVESAKGSAFNMRTREYILRFGFATLALIFAVVMYNDVVPPLIDWVRRHIFGS